MTLTVYNTLTRRKDPFVPLSPGAVKMYVCGVTVYDLCHLGHARAYIVWDMVRRYLQWRGYAVRYVQNITDIDDKILKRAQERGETMEAIAERYIAAYDADMAQLNVLPADEYPRATQFVPAMIDAIAILEREGYAYAADGDVYYAVRQFPGYGKLSGRKLEDMQAGASGRVDEQEAHKRYPLDFALWKAAKPGEPSWESPWGNGRPGWHIECSAMVRSRLGDSIDIHAGGADLQFPHHENEIAQSEAAFKAPLAKYWLHNGFVNIDGEKMSKSLHNFRTIRDLLEVYDPMALRLFVLQAHYRQPIDFTAAAMEAATRAWETIRDGLRFGDEVGDRLGWDRTASVLELEAAAIARFRTAMDDDFNTSVALSVLFELAKTLKTERNRFGHEGKIAGDAIALQGTWETLCHLAAVLGLQATGDRSEATVASTGGISEADIAAAIAQRQAAKQAKNFAEADRIRNVLKAQGITLVDRPGGETHWLRE